MSDDWIGIIIPTEDDKWFIARATITDDDIDTLSDAVISVADAGGVKKDLKYPIVLVKDIETLRQKLIEDIEEMGKPFKIEEYQKFFSLHDVRVIINRRFGYNGNK